MSSLASIVRCAIRNGMSLNDINGHVSEWVKHCRNGLGERPTTEEFLTEWSAQTTARDAALVATPSEPVEDE